jgi:hypothetical protein
LPTTAKIAEIMEEHNAVTEDSTRPLLTDHAPTMMLFRHWRGRLSLAIHDDTRVPLSPHQMGAS